MSGRSAPLLGLLAACCVLAACGGGGTEPGRSATQADRPPPADLAVRAGDEPAATAVPSSAGVDCASPLTVCAGETGRPAPTASTGARARRCASRIVRCAGERGASEPSGGRAGCGSPLELCRGEEPPRARPSRAAPPPGLGISRRSHRKGQP